MSHNGMMGDRSLRRNNRRNALHSGNRLQFRFVFVFVSLGRGEAVWVYDGGIFPNVGAKNGDMFSGGALVVG